ncbi:MAG: 50S ribosomal protein L24 [Nitrososphaeraceae archaeon]
MAKNSKSGFINNLGVGKTMVNMNIKLLHVPKHVRDAMIGATLADTLRQQYGRRSARVTKGDSVKVLRGEYSGIEGKVEKVNTKRGTLAIEGIQREKVRGGNVKVQIHASNVMITAFNLDDKYRKNKLSPTLEAEPISKEKKDESKKYNRKVSKKKKNRKKEESEN